MNEANPPGRGWLTFVVIVQLVGSLYLALDALMASEMSFVITGVLGVLAVFTIAISVLLRTRRWAWISAVILNLLQIVFGIFVMFAAPDAPEFGGIHIGLGLVLLGALAAGRRAVSKPSATAVP